MDKVLKTIEEQWIEFSSTIFQNYQPTEVQYEAMRKTFYAGFYTMLQCAGRIGEPDIPEEVALEWLQSRENEFMRFAKEVVVNHIQENN